MPRKRGITDEMIIQLYQNGTPYEEMCEITNNRLTINELFVIAMDLVRKEHERGWDKTHL